MDEEAVGRVAIASWGLEDSRASGDLELRPWRLSVTARAPEYGRVGAPWHRRGPRLSAIASRADWRPGGLNASPTKRGRKTPCFLQPFCRCHASHSNRLAPRALRLALSAVLPPMPAHNARPQLAHPSVLGLPPRTSLSRRHDCPEAVWLGQPAWRHRPVERHASPS